MILHTRHGARRFLSSSTMTNANVETVLARTESISSIAKGNRVEDADNALNEVRPDEERRMLRKFDGLLLPPLALMFVVRWHFHHELLVIDALQVFDECLR
jgi:hypothetical protein